MPLPLTITNFKLDNNMRNIYIIANILICLAEHSLRGLNAWTRRVMGECLKTPWAVLSRDLSCNRWTLPGRLWVSSNKSHDRHILLSNLKLQNSIKHFGIIASTGKVSNSNYNATIEKEI
jgi:hypothetical protein